MEPVQRLISALTQHPLWLAVLLVAIAYLWLRSRLLRRARQRRQEQVRVRTRAAGKRHEEEVAQALAVLGREGYVTLANIRVEGLTESEIDALAIGPNGIFCVEAKSRSGVVRIESQGWSYTPYATGVTSRLAESPAEQNRRHIADLQRFLLHHLSTGQVEKLRFHNVICLSDQTRVEGASRAGAAVVPLGRLTAFVRTASGTNPLPRPEWSRVARLLTEETARNEARFRERQARRGKSRRS